MKNKVVVLGSVNMDLVVQSPTLPRPGETVMGGDFFQVPGGKGANQAVAVKRLAKNSNIAFLGAVGSDTFGDTLKGNLQEEDLDVKHLLQVSNLATGVALIMVAAEEGGENQISVAPGANSAVDRKYVDSLPEAVFESANVFLASLEVPVAAVRRGLERARACGAVTILNPAPVPISEIEAVRALLPLVDVLIPNLIEAESLCQATGADGDYRKLAGQLLAAGPKAVVITLGSKGCVVSGASHFGGKEQVTVVPVGKVDRVVDTTAAGDCFCGAVAAQLAEGCVLESAIEFATAAAAICVSRCGAQPSIPFRSEVVGSPG